MIWRRARVYRGRMQRVREQFDRSMRTVLAVGMPYNSYEPAYDSIGSIAKELSRTTNDGFNATTASGERSSDEAAGTANIRYCRIGRREERTDGEV